MRRLFSRTAGTLALMERRAASLVMRHAQPTSPSAHKGRTLITLLMMLLTTMTAWAENVTYIDENGHEQTVTATVLDGGDSDVTPVTPEA